MSTTEDQPASDTDKPPAFPGAAPPFSGEMAREMALRSAAVKRERQRELRRLRAMQRAVASPAGQLGAGREAAAVMAWHSLVGVLARLPKVQPRSGSDAAALVGALVEVCSTLDTRANKHGATNATSREVPPDLAGLVREAMAAAVRGQERERARVVPVSEQVSEAEPESEQ